MERAGKGAEAVIGWMPPKPSIQTLFHFIGITPLHPGPADRHTQTHSDNVQYAQEAVKKAAGTGVIPKHTEGPY